MINIDMKKNERKEEFLRHKKALDEYYQRKIKAIYELYPEFAQTTNESGENRKGKKNVTKAIMAVIKENQGHFSLHQVAEWLKAKDPLLAVELSNTKISTTLTRLEARKKIKRVSEKGDRPVMYARRLFFKVRHVNNVEPEEIPG